MEKITCQTRRDSMSESLHNLISILVDDDELLKLRDFVADNSSATLRIANTETAYKFPNDGSSFISDLLVAVSEGKQITGISFMM